MIKTILNYCSGCCLLWLSVGCQHQELIPPLPTERIEMTVEHDGSRYHLADDGIAYREAGEHWTPHATVFDPQAIRDAYVEEAGETFRVAPDSGRRFAVRRAFAESFEELPLGLTGLPQLVHEERLLWGSFTLQGPRAQSVSDYVELRRQLMAGESDYRDCRIEVSAERAHRGQQSLRCFAPRKPGSMVTCKASVSSPLILFRNGDDFWYEASYFVEQHLPLTLADLECEFTAEQAGIRLRFFDEGYLGVELKALHKPQYRQLPENRIRFPVGQWVTVRWHLVLSHDPTKGHIRVWQNEQLILDQPATTLPFRSAVYNSLEIGISAHSDEQNDCTLFIDDIRVGTNPGDLEPNPTGG